MNMSEEFSRAYGVLQADKAPMGEGCKSLVLQDLAEKFSQYFDLASPPKMTIKEKKGKTVVEITFEAERVKKFNVIK
ncbi:MAG: hypothetical protein IKC37_03755 [Clostridia bacterium]|nr:hypothetical protein [Clostridia bacterium]